MKTRILIVIVGFVAGGAVVTGTAVALDQARTSVSSPVVAPMTMSGMMGATRSSAGTAKLVIQHVQKGCHVWSYNHRQAASMRLSLKHGAQLRIVDQDVDPHGLVQLAGPKIAFRPNLMMGQSLLLVFKQPAVYRFKTRVIEMGSMEEVETIGPDNKLRLTVVVR